MQQAFPTSVTFVILFGLLGWPLMTHAQNVGIGTATPAEKLHILNGSLRIDDGTNPYTLPPADGANGEILTTDGAGNVTWQTPAGGGTVNANAPLTGDGSAGTPLDLQFRNALEEVGGFLQWGGPLVDSTEVMLSGFDTYFTGNGQVALNTTTPPDAAKLHSLGDASFPIGVSGESNSGTTGAIVGNNTGAGVGVLGITANGTGGAVQGSTPNPTSPASGVSGFATAGAGAGATFGVFGTTASDGAGAAGVRGVATSASGDVLGVLGETQSTTDGAVGVRGFASGATGQIRGVEGESDANFTGATGVIGFADGATDATFGVWGETNSDGTTSPFGQAPAGVNGQSLNASAGQTFGVRGIVATNTSTAAGVFGQGTGAWAGFFNGDLGATNKFFHIDHPGDPANYFLNHHSMEGPEPFTFYRGNVTTDGSGLARVQLPTYFDTLNAKPQVNLTVVGSFADAMVKEKVSGNAFTIQTEEPNVEVNWTVTAVRNDPYIQRHRRPTVEKKTGQAKGRYLMPELYGQPQSKAIYGGPIDMKRGEHGQESTGDSKIAPLPQALDHGTKTNNANSAR